MTDVLRIFLSSPGDVAEERTIVASVVEEINAGWARWNGLRLDLVRWETDVPPGAGVDPQAVVNAHLGDDFDIFLGVLWARLGTPTLRSGSGTQEEFELAYAKHQRSPESVRLMLYFCNRPIDPERVDAEQLARVHAFRKRTQALGVLAGKPYRDTDEFAKLLRLHLGGQIQSWLDGKWGARVSASSEPGSGPGPARRHLKTGTRTAPSTYTDVPTDDGGATLEAGLRELSIGAEAAREIHGELGQITKHLRALVQDADHGGERPATALATTGLEQAATAVTSAVTRLSHHVQRGIDALVSWAQAPMHLPPSLAAIPAVQGVLDRFIEASRINLELAGALQRSLSSVPRHTVRLGRAKDAIYRALETSERDQQTAHNLSVAARERLQDASRSQTRP